MQGLLKYLSPFAPDQSGAVSVLYDLGGITVICDAGGCTGNVCGFDEPRWFYGRRAIFSAGLRDMDAILGRDDRMVEKLKDAAQHLDASFAALVGTPVPAVIATDFKALKRMAQKRCGMPVVTVACQGTQLYDKGASDTYMELFKTFTEDTSEKKHILGVLGLTPLDISHIHGRELLMHMPEFQSFDELYTYGMGSGVDAIKDAGAVEKNLVVAPAGLAAARYLEKRFGTPYEVAYPFLRPSFKDALTACAGKRVLVIHQQVAANAIREELVKAGAQDVVVGSWFMMQDIYKEAADVHFDKEDQFGAYVREQGFDVVIGDDMLKRAVPGYTGAWIHIPHFAVSGVYEEDIWSE